MSKTKYLPEVTSPDGHLSSSIAHCTAIPEALPSTRGRGKLRAASWLKLKPRRFHPNLHQLSSPCFPSPSSHPVVAMETDFNRQWEEARWKEAHKHSWPLNYLRIPSLT